MKKKSREELLHRTVCQLIRTSYYANDLKTLKLVYELLVMEKIIDEFHFDMESWKELNMPSGSYFMFFKDSHFIPQIDNDVIMMLKQKYLYFMEIIH